MKKIKLDKYQKKVIKNNSQNLLVIAGAGSGKTLTIIYKIKKLIKNNIKPNEILCITFTKSTAISLKQKLLKEHINLNVKTFHSLGYQIIKKNKNVSLVNHFILDNIIIKYLNNYSNLNILINTEFLEFGKGNSVIIKNNILKNSNHIIYLKDTIKTFINLFKGNNYNLKNFSTFFQINKSQNLKVKQFRHKKFLNLVKQIYIEYENYLETYKKIDYNDMINKAIDIVKKEGIFTYKYIIIDEYQDTSLNKCQLVKEIQNKTSASLMTVGDDWQSIYQFTGSNLEIFTNFKKYFPNAKIIKLKKTYRNSQELIKVAQKFIMKNKNQINKKISSYKKEKTPVHIYYYKENPKNIWDDILKKIKTKTLVLGRNNDDIKPLKLNKYTYYMTVHKSKGLEAENVIIINLENNINSFPSKVIESEYLMYVLSKQEDYEYAEERRLFYVALTRTKNKVILLVNRENPSLFVCELLKDSSKYIKIINP